MRRQTKSDCQAGPVSQDQICQRKHDVEFCFLFLKPSVSRLLESEKSLHNTENMFYLGSYRGLCVFPLLGLVLTAFAELAHLAGATVDLIPNLLAGFVSYFGIFSLLCAEVPAVSIECIFLSVHEFGCHGHIGYIGCRRLDSVYNTAVPVHTNMCLISEMPGVAFLRLMGVGITLLFPNMWLNRVTGKIQILAFFIPVDDKHAIIALRFYNKITGVKAIDKSIAWIGSLANRVVERQDKRVVETQEPKVSALRMKEKLVAADKPIIEYRKRRDQLQNK